MKLVSDEAVSPVFINQVRNHILSAVFDLNPRDFYFTVLVEVFTNHLAESTYFPNHIEGTEHEIMVLKPANTFQIIRCCPNFEKILIDGFRHHSISLLNKSFSNVISANCKDQAINNSNICYLIYYGARKVFHKIVQQMFF